MLTASLIFGSNCRTVAWAWDSLFKSNAKIHKTSTSGQVVISSVIVSHIEYSNRRVTLDCECKVDEKVVLAGEAIVLAQVESLTREQNVNL